MYSPIQRHIKKMVSEEGQKTIKAEGRKEEDRQEIEAKPFLESKRKLKRTSSK